MIQKTYVKENVYNAPRVGLTLEHETFINGLYTQYLMKEYRFVCCPKVTKIEKGMLAICAKSKEIPDNVITEKMKLMPEYLGRWTTHYINGQYKCPELFFSEESRMLEGIKIRLEAYGLFSRLTSQNQNSNSP